MQSVDRFPAVPQSFVGVWQRTLLEGEGLVTDTASQVFWLQTRHWHGDLRLPPDRPDFAGCTSIAATSPQQRRWLASQKGFAGLTEVVVRDAVDTRQGATTPAAQSRTSCEWHRRIDFQPAGPSRDIGIMLFSPDQNSVEEYGVESAYHETWHRLPGSGGPSAAWQRSTDSSSGPLALLLIAGGYFFHLRDRFAALPAAAGATELSAVIARTGNSAPLDMELSFGEWKSAHERGIILHSSLPWREGQEVALDPAWQTIDPLS